ncbi:CoA-transferase family III [Pseudomonas corrugata]|nr:CoA-transferase family III [Pseudomonas corrugata]
MTALNGLRVIEIGTLIAAPFAARLLGEFGAEVIKIESMGHGDPLRKWRKMHEGTSLWWYLQSRNKKSLALNLKAPEGIDIVKQLVESAEPVSCCPPCRSRTNTRRPLRPRDGIR